MPHFNVLDAWARVIRRLWFIYTAPALLLPLQYITSLAHTIPLAAIVARARLVDSTATLVRGPDLADWQSCNHPVMLPRGNQYLRWWTCGACASRWPRLPGETIEG
jgi:hypothetical protein